MTSRVFVVQNQHRWDSAKERFVPKYDFASAEPFGSLEFLLSPTAAPFNVDPIVAELKDKLADFGPEDHLLLVGNPVLIGLACTIAAEANLGSVALLQWSGKDRRYIEVKAMGLFTFSDPNE